MEAATIKPRLWSLWHAQGGVCGICAKDMPLPSIVGTPCGDEPNIEHVWPRRLRHEDMTRMTCIGVKRGRGTEGNTVAAHHDCNVRKGNRAPTGCEQIVLMWVNARMGEELKTW
jgi:5-methylcytosine-specific restriction endonuclease McrA